MIEEVEKVIAENNLADKKILIGLSGGIDSAVLFDILSKLNYLDLTAIHLNHNWRGESSRADEEFAKKTAENAGAGFYSETLGDNFKKTETAAREARYDFFARCQKKFNAGAVFLAHNKNDNVETLIYRLIKGTGPSGLTSIPPVRDFYFRPLLNFTRGEIEEYANKNGILYVVDKSNFDTKYKRNLIREKILPAMLEINKEAINSISNFIEINKMSQNIIQDAVNSALDGVLKNEKIIRDRFLDLKTELQYEIINKFLKGVLKTRDFKTIDRVVKYIKKTAYGKISISSGKFLKVYNNAVYLTDSAARKLECQTPLRLGESNFAGQTFLIEETTAPARVFGLEYVNLNFENNYVLRTRKNGDKFQPFGSKTAQKLKTFLIKKKIPLELRDKIPLIALGDEVLYITGVALSEKLRVEKNQKCCKITVKGA